MWISKSYVLENLCPYYCHSYAAWTLWHKVGLNSASGDISGFSMDCMEPDVVAPGEGLDSGNTLVAAQDDGKTLANGEADQVCHNVSVPLFTSK